MTVTINGSTGVTTPDVTSDSYTGPISVSSSAPDNSVQLNASGNLGLGVTPSAWRSSEKAFQIGSIGSLSQISGAVKVNGNTYWNSSNQAIYLTSDLASTYVQTSGAHQWLTAPSGTAGNAISFTQAMTLDASGNLQVGTTSLSAGRLNAASAAGFWGISVRDAVGNSALIQFRNTSNSEVGAITTNQSTTSYVTSSDYRLKENIAPMTGALAKVAALKPVTYTWKANGSAGQGFIAHELQAVVPECVTGEKDATRVEQYEVTPAVLDDNGQVVTPAVMGERTVPVYQGIDTSFLVATLTAAIQEQQAIITDLKARIEVLEAK